jgi:hypothetical protein
MTCAICGVALPVVEKLRGRPRTYCSTTCRRQRERVRRRARHWRAVGERWRAGGHTALAEKYLAAAATLDAATSIVTTTPVDVKTCLQLVPGPFWWPSWR